MRYSAALLASFLLIVNGLLGENAHSLKSLLFQASHITEINENSAGFSDEIFNA